MSPDEKWRVAGWGLRLLAAMSPQEAVEDIERSLDLFSDEDCEQAREALLTVRADYIAWQESTVASQTSSWSARRRFIASQTIGLNQCNERARMMIQFTKTSPRLM